MRIDMYESDLDPLCTDAHEEGCGGTFLLGTIRINGLPMHAEALRVCERSDGVQCAYHEQHPSESDFCHCATQYDALAGLDESAFRTTELPGLEGKWVILATPYGG